MLMQNSQMKADNSRLQLLPLVGENVLDYLIVFIIDQEDLSKFMYVLKLVTLPEMVNERPHQSFVCHACG